MSVARIYPGGQVAVSVDGGPDINPLQVLELQRKIENLERAVESQRTIGVAIGLLAQRYDCTTDQAWAQLRGLSNVTNTKVREVARMLRDAFDDVVAEADVATLALLCQHLPDGEHLPNCEHLPDQRRPSGAHRVDTRSTVGKR